MELRCLVNSYLKILVFPAAVPNAHVRELGMRGFHVGDDRIDAAVCDWLETKATVFETSCPRLSRKDIDFGDVFDASSSGAHGVMQRATLKSTGRMLVIKRPTLKGSAGDGAIVRLFKHEAAIQVRLEVRGVPVMWCFDRLRCAVACCIAFGAGRL